VCQETETGQLGAESERAIAQTVKNRTRNLLAYTGEPWEQ